MEEEDAEAAETEKEVFWGFFREGVRGEAIPEEGRGVRDLRGGVVALGEFGGVRAEAGELGVLFDWTKGRVSITILGSLLSRFGGDATMKG